MNRMLPIILVLVLAIAGGAWYVMQSSSDDVAATDTPPQATEPDATSADTEATADAAILPDRFLGDENAPVTVIEYASYTCPHCATFHADQFKRLKAEYVDTGKVKLIHREVYFDRYGLWGGLLANCGGDARYYGISGMLYDKQREWIGSGEGDEIIANLIKLGKTAGLSDAEIDACLSDEEMAAQLVATYQANAEADGITATPTLVIDGEKHSNMSYEALKEIIDAKLAN